MKVILCVSVQRKSRFQLKYFGVIIIGVCELNPIFFILFVACQIYSFFSVFWFKIKVETEQKKCSWENLITADSSREVKR